MINRFNHKVSRGSAKVFVSMREQLFTQKLNVAPIQRNSNSLSPRVALSISAEISTTDVHLPYGWMESVDLTEIPFTKIVTSSTNSPVEAGDSRGVFCVEWRLSLFPLFVCFRRTDGSMSVSFCSGWIPHYDMAIFEGERISEWLRVLSFICMFILNAPIVKLVSPISIAVHSNIFMITILPWS